MKKIIILLAALLFLYVPPVYADDVPLTKEQKLTIEIEKVTNARDYLQEKTEVVLQQAQTLNAFTRQADREILDLERQLDKLLKKGKKR